MPDSRMPRYLTAADAQIIREVLAEAEHEIERRLRGRGADPQCFDHEIGLALARRACLRNLDLLASANATIERLEAVVAELGAGHERARISASPNVDPYLAAVNNHKANGNGHHHNGYTEHELRAMREAIPRNPEAAHDRGCLCDVCRS